MKISTRIFAALVMLFAVNAFAQTQGSISARSFILTDADGRKVTLIPQTNAPIGDYIFEIPLVPALASTGILGSQQQQAPADPEPYITFATGGTKLTNNRVLAAGTGVSLTNAGADNGNLTIANTGVVSLAGTTNRVSVSGSTGSVTLNLPQDIHTSATPTFSNLTLSSIPASSTSSNIVVSNSGTLQTRTIASLGKADGSEPILTFSSDGGSLANNRVAGAGSGIGISVGGSDNGAFTISNTGVLSNAAGSGISVSGATGNVTITNTGLLSASAGSGIGVNTTAGNVTITNNGVRSAIAGTGILVDNSTGDVTITNTGVTSVGLSMPPIFSVANSPVTTTGTLGVTMNDQAANTFLAGPVSGNDAAPSFRALDFADFDALVWTLQGNDVASGAYIGTTNGESFDMRVNGTTRLILTDRVTVQRDNDGDLRGFYATDMQAQRSNSTQVASANYSTISGGRNNRASAIGATIGGGGTDGYDVNGNIASARGTTIGGGKGNEANVDLSTIGGGDFNTAAGYVSSINGGQFNITADYGAAVSGGISNTAGAELAFVGGGTENNASGVRSYIGGGQGNTASGEYSSIIGGQGNTATGTGSVAMGTGTVSQGSRSIALGGGVGASGAYSVAMGGFGNASGNFSFSTGGAFATIGDAQHSEMVARNSTSDSNWTELFLDGSSASMTVPSNTGWTYVVHITGLSSTGNVGSYEIKGAIKNVSGTTNLIGTAVVTTIAEDVASWDVRVSAEDTSDKLVIEVLGADATDIRWVASVSTTEVSY
jgi:hypothetical protein